MQARGRGAVRPPIGIAFDGDLGNQNRRRPRRGDAERLVGQGRSAPHLAQRVSRSSLKAAQLADVLAGFYAGRPAGGGTGGIGAAREGMIGMPEGGAPDATPPLAAPLSRKTADGTPQYNSTITGLVDTAESSVLIRNLLLAQNDGNASIVLAGPATGSCGSSPCIGSRPQIVAKVKQLVVAAGSFPPDRRIRRSRATSPPRARCLPSGRRRSSPWARKSEPRCRILGRASRATSPGRRLIPSSTRTARSSRCRTTRRRPRWRRCSMPSIPTRATFTLSEPGTISVLDDGRTQFTPGADGKHRYLIVDPAQKDRITKLYTDMVSAPPAPRPGRRGGAAPTP